MPRISNVYHWNVHEGIITNHHTMFILTGRLAVFRKRLETADRQLMRAQIRVTVSAIQLL